MASKNEDLNLDDMEEAAKKILHSVKLVKNLNENYQTLIQDFETAASQADEALKVEVHQEIGVEWKGKMKKMRDIAIDMKQKCISMQQCKKNLKDTIDKCKIKKNDATSADYEEVVKQLRNVIEVIVEFSKELDTFTTAVKDAHAAANEAMDKIEQSHKDEENEKFKQQVKGAGAAVALAGAAFFTGGAALLLAGGAAGYGLLTADKKERINKLKDQVQALKNHLNQLTSLIEKVEKQGKNNAEMKKLMDDVLQEFLRKVEEKEEKEKMQVQMQEKDEEMEKLRKELEELRAARGKESD